MQRLIKFRVWDTKDKLWVAGWSIGQLGVSSIPGGNVYMEYTGLRDRNGTEVYEGDVLSYRFRTHAGNELEEGSVGMEDFMWCVSSSRGDYEPYSLNRINDVEVIGNIYESPELLEDAGHGADTPLPDTAPAPTDQGGSR